MSALEVRGLRKSFGGTPVLQGLDLTVPSGAFAAVLGPSGCGKTTLLRVVAGFEGTDAGEIRIGDELVAGGGAHVAPERRCVGIVPQEGALFPHLSVADNVAFGLPRRGAGGRAGRRARVGELLDLVGLADLGRRMPAELSGGQQQRVAVARALAPGPHVVLLDEPFSALDAGLRAAVREDVRAALLATGATAVLVTHDQEEALSTASLVAVMRDGLIVQSATPEQVYSAPADVRVATFVGEAVVLLARLEHGLALTALGPIPAMPSFTALNGRTGPPPPHGLAVAGAEYGDGRRNGAGARGRVVLRPEQLRIVDAGLGIRARVLGTIFYGHDTSVRLTLDAVAADGSGGEPLTVLCRTQDPPPAAGEVGLVVTGPVPFYPDE